MSAERSVYLDTNAWNGLLNWETGSPANGCRRFEYLFSSCNLDEFCLADISRAKALADLAWERSNRRKLHDHLEMTAIEIAAFQRGESSYPIYHDDPGFQIGWQAMRAMAWPNGMREALQRQVTAAKKQFLEHLRESRRIFMPIFQLGRKLGLRTEWNSFLQELETDPALRSFVLESLRLAGLAAYIPDPDSTPSLPFWSLPATSSWVQYWLALSYIACHETGRLTHPDLGDQFDFRHACYAGIADLFVTGDARMKYLLTERVPDRRAEVLDLDAFLDMERQ